MATTVFVLLHRSRATLHLRHRFGIHGSPILQTIHAWITSSSLPKSALGKNCAWLECRDVAMGFCFAKRVSGYLLVYSRILFPLVWQRASCSYRPTMLGIRCRLRSAYRVTNHWQLERDHPALLDIWKRVLSYTSTTDRVPSVRMWKDLAT